MTDAGKPFNILSLTVAVDELERFPMSKNNRRRQREAAARFPAAAAARKRLPGDRPVRDPEREAAAALLISLTSSPALCR